MHETPLDSRHRELGARMVPFAGWGMPLQYAPILDEARRVRRSVGVFDLCHMGRLRCVGPQAETLLQRVLTNDVSKIAPGSIRYALLTNEAGGVLDDVLVYRDPRDASSFLVVVNAGNRERDVEWIRSRVEGLDCELKDLSFDLGMLALQGPRSAELLAPLVDLDLDGLGYYCWAHGEVLVGASDGIPCSVSRTGYTGEDGFEIYLATHETARVFDRLLADCDRVDGAAIGLGARDTLRLEAGMALYGHELDEDTNPYEAGLGWAVKLRTGFIGEAALAEVKASGPKRKLVGLSCAGRRVPRQGYAIVDDADEVGCVASGTFSPTLDKPIATAFVRPESAEVGLELGFKLRDRVEPATVVPLPFYKRPRPG